jgi:hypothetical protein
MAYSEKAKVLRRCKAYALWGGGLCAGHTYKRRGKSTGDTKYSGMPTKAPPCTCIAYQWPHRPSGGLCNWPDAPLWKSTTPAGTHWPTKGLWQHETGIAAALGWLWQVV